MDFTIVSIAQQNKIKQNKTQVATGYILSIMGVINSPALI